MHQHLERLDGVAPFLRAPVRELLRLSEFKLHRPLMIVFGWRAVAEQELLYQQGRTFNRDTQVWEVSNAALVVTNARPGRSAHNVISVAGEPFAMAVDVVPLKIDGTADWNPSEQYLDDLYRAAWNCGLDPLGDPVGSFLKSDKLHFEEPKWMLKLDGLDALLPVAHTEV